MPDFIPTVRAGEARIPAVGLGTWKASNDNARRACEHALDVGYRHIDTAQLYGNELEVGQALQSTSVPREEIFVTTKVWRELHAPAAVVTSTEESLRKLGGYVDLLLIHWPHQEMQLEATLDAMMSFVADGRVRHVGVSNFPSALVRKAAAHAPIVCNQVEYHPYLAQTAVLEACREHDVAVAAYSPLARGAVLDDPVLTEIGQAHEKSAAQITLRWLVQQEGVVAVPKSVTPERITANLALDFTLTDDEMTRIHELARPDGRIIDPSAFAVPWDPS